MFIAVDGHIVVIDDISGLAAYDNERTLDTSVVSQGHGDGCCITHALKTASLSRHIRQINIFVFTV